MDLLPELHLLIGARLDIRDLAACVRVSKQWNDAFTPFLYLTALPEDYQKHWSSFQPRLHLIHNLVISLTTTELILNSLVLNCKHLKRLEIAFQPALESARSCLRLLEGNPQLVQFRATELDRAHLTPSLLLESLDRYCPRMTNLRLLLIPTDSGLWGQVLVRTLSSRLTRLELGWEGETLDVEAWTGTLQEDAWPEFPELRELVVSVPRDRRCWSDQLRLFKQAPKLESLSWQLNHLPRLPFPIKGFVNTLCGILRGQDNVRNSSGSLSPCWPRLHSIRLSENLSLARSSFKDAIVAQILRNVPTHLRKLSLPRAEFDTLAWRALQPHLASLEVLELDTPSWMIQEFLTSCPNLKGLRGGKFEAFEAVSEVGANILRHKAIARVRETVKSTMRVRALLLQQGELETLYGEDGEQVEYEHALPTVYPLPRPWICSGLQVLWSIF